MMRWVFINILINIKSIWIFAAISPVWRIGCKPSYTLETVILW